MKIAALVEVAACLLGGLALAESPVAPTTPCPADNAVTQRHLLGLWRATFDGLTQGATLLLERHPEFADSVRGAIHRDGDKAPASGPSCPSRPAEALPEIGLDFKSLSITVPGMRLACRCSSKIAGA